MSDKKVIYFPLALSVAVAVYRSERPSGRGVTKTVSICRKLKRAATICKLQPNADGACELVYSPAVIDGKLGTFYLRGPSHLACALAIPKSTPLPS